MLSYVRLSRKRRMTQLSNQFSKATHTLPMTSSKAPETIEVAMGRLLRVSFTEKSENKSTMNSTREECIKMMDNYLTRLNLIDAVQFNLPVIHVAGTKGKGSTCAMTERILRESGYKTGLFTSPHLISPCERFRINGKPITPNRFLHHFHSIWNILEATRDQSDGHPPMAWFFRFFTLLAFRVFVEEKVDVAILEVGLGGRLDATNVIRKPIVCGITTLDLDHTQILGDSIDKIAYAKAGIFKPNVPAFTVEQTNTLAMDTLYTCAQETNTPLYTVPLLSAFGKRLDLCMEGDHQRMNAALAVTLASVFMNQNGAAWKSSVIDYPSFMTPAVVKGLECAFWPARSHTLRDNSLPNLSIHIDGGHTLKSLECCSRWYLQNVSSSANVSSLKVLIFASHYERNVGRIMTPLVDCPFNMVLFCPTAVTRPSMLKMPTLEQAIERAGLEDIDLEEEIAGNCSVDSHPWQYTMARLWRILEKQSDTPSAAMSIQTSSSDCLNEVRNICREQSDVRVHVLVTGSLYLAGEMLQLLGWEE